MIIHDLGTFPAGQRPCEASLGIYLSTDGWYAQCWREHYGPFESRDAAEIKLETICSCGMFRTVDALWDALITWVFLFGSGLVVLALVFWIVHE